MRKIDKKYRQQIAELTERAKLSQPNAKGLNLGERCFVELLHFYIERYRTRQLTTDELQKRKKELEQLLTDYFDQAHMFREDVKIRLRMGQLLTEAEKSGCPTCGRLVRIFDGREKGEAE